MWLYLFELQTKSLLDHQITIGGLNQMTIYIPHPVGVGRYIECVQFILNNTYTRQLLLTLGVKKSDYITLH